MSPIDPTSPQEGSSRVEDPATVRRTFIWLSLAATIMLLPPRQWVSSAIMGVVTLALFVWHMRKQGQAEDAKKKADAAQKAEAAKDAAASKPVEDGNNDDEDASEEDDDSDAAASPVGSGEKDGTHRAG